MGNDFPRMLYKVGGPHEIHGGKFDYIVVSSEAEQDEALAAGWHLSTPEAVAAGGKAAVKVEAVAATETGDEAPPTRAELEAKAKELGIEFDGRTNDAKLGAKIAAKLKA
jgi:hypothetical protein